MMIKRCLTSFVGVTFLSAQAWAQAPASAAPQPALPPVADAPGPPVPKPSLSDTLQGEAKANFESGKLLFDNGDFAGAVLKFERAYQLSNEPELLWNMAAAEKKQRHYARLEKLLREYLSKGGASLSEHDRGQAQALLDTVPDFIAEVSVTVNEADATVSADDEEVGKTPLSAPLRLDMGNRNFRVTKAGFKDFTATRALSGGAKTTLEVTLEAVVHEGRLRVAAEAGAAVRVDGKLLGVGEWEGRLPSGAHTVEVSAEGKQSWHADSVVQDGELTTVLVSLQGNDKSPAAAAVPTWLWIAGGAVVASGLGVGAYFVFKPGPKGPPAAVDGSLGTVELPLGR